MLDDEDEEPYFNPTEGNVAFASAFDGWAFQTQHFAALSAPKLGCPGPELHQGLWGAFYYSPKRKAVLPIKPEQAHKLTPLFVQVRPVIFFCLFSSVFSPICQHFSDPS